MRAPNRSTMRLLPLAVCATLFALATAARLPAGDLQVDGKLVSTAEAGTPPLQVSSPDRVENLNADMVDGMDADSFRFDGVIRVGKKGTGDFDTIQGAIDSLGPGNPRPMLISVGPGVYRERVVLGPNVFLRGAGERVTVIEHVGSDTFDASAATLVLPHTGWVRDLTVRLLDINNFTIGIYVSGLGEIQDVEVRYHGRAFAAIGLYSEPDSYLEIDNLNLSMLAFEGATYAAAFWNGDGTRLRRSRVYMSGPMTTIGFVNTGGPGPWSLRIEDSDLYADEVLAEDSNSWATVVRRSTVVGSLLGNVRCYGVDNTSRFYVNECPPEF